MFEKKFKHVLYQKKKVYNLIVANFHTYFVGLLALLVHNAQCIGTAIREILKVGFNTKIPLNFINKLKGKG